MSRKAKPIPSGYDIAAHPDADTFDPVAWFEGTGEDLGLPPEYREQYEKLKAKYRAEREAREKSSRT